MVVVVVVLFIVQWCNTLLQGINCNEFKKSGWLPSSTAGQHTLPTRMPVSKSFSNVQMFQIFICHDVSVPSVL